MGDVRAPWRFGTLECLSLAAAALLGILNLPQPFDGDQALFMTGAREFDAGKVLYKDFWDLKPPGIYAFYLLAGELFGFNEIGLHFFELVYLLAFAAFLTATLRDRFRRPETAALLPLLTVGLYYAVVRKWHLTQVEGLVGPLLYASLWFAVGRDEGKGGAWIPRLLISGAAGGMALLFKPMFALILLPFWWTAIVQVPSIRNEPAALRVVRRGLAILAGAALAVAPAVGYFVRHGCLDLAYRTLFVIPPKVLAIAPRKSFLDFARNAGWFVLAFAPAIALALPGLRTPLRKPRDLVLVHLLAWLLLGAVIILLQKTSWWGYHYLLLTVPIGVFAARGIEDLQDRWSAGLPKAKAALGGAAFLALCSFGLVTLIGKVVDLGVCGFALTRKSAGEFRARVYPVYREAAEETAFLSASRSLPGGIFVAGNPVFYHVSGREQALVLNGWALEYFLPEQWVELRGEIGSGKAAYLYLVAEVWNSLPGFQPELRRTIEERYALLRGNDAGCWFVRR